jgi:uncharacterized protein (DUF983 family)
MPASSNLSALAQCKCPRCREGEMFKNPALSKKFTEMPVLCPVCGVAFEPEPGFFWGAMYFSYAFSVGFTMLTAFLVYFLLNNPSVLVYMSFIVPVVVLASPWSLRYSRALMLHLFGGLKYDPDWKIHDLKDLER